MTDYGIAIFDQHAKLLAESRIPPEFARKRGYRSMDTRTQVAKLEVTKAGCNVPGLLIPLRDKAGSVWGHQYRPDQPRLNSKGKPIKYETPRGQRNGVDVPPGVGPMLDDPTIPLWITEGTRKADCAAVLGLCCVALPGVWSWVGTNSKGGKTAIPDWRDIALNGRRVILAFDSDVMVKDSVILALTQLAEYLKTKGAKVEYLHLPNDDDTKTGLDDFIGAGHTADDLWALVSVERPAAQEVIDLTEPPEPAEPAEPPEPASLTDVFETFTRWLGDGYDLGSLCAVLAIAAVERLDGDPPWLLVVSGSGNTKTETVTALAGAGAHVTSTITSEGALISATSSKERSKDATGGLLRKIGERGILVIKDTTSILSMNRDARNAVLGALREVADGYWERNVGTDGGKSLTWQGRIVVIGAVTTSWDTHHAVIASMGDRFLLYRSDSAGKGRKLSGRRSLANIGSETQMRAELADVTGRLLAHLHLDDIEVDPEDAETLLGLADIVTIARTPVERDQRGDVIDAHAPEAPTRLVKYLGQLLRGGRAIGLDRQQAMQICQRVAHDCLPPLRLSILGAVYAHPWHTTTELAKKLNRPRQSIDRVLQELVVLGLVTQDEQVDPLKRGWIFAISDDVDKTDLATLLAGSQPFTRKVTTSTQEHKEGRTTDTRPPTNISGDAPEQPPTTSTTANSQPPGETCECGRPLSQGDLLSESTSCASCAW